MNQKTAKNLPVLAWTIWLVGASFYFYEFLLQVFPNVVLSEMMKNLAAGAVAIGFVQTAYFLGYACMQIPGGMLLDRFGPRKLLTVATLLCALGAIIFAKSTNIYQAEISRFITGLGSAFALIGALVLASRWFPANRFALLNGLIITIGMSGAFFGEAPFGYLVQLFHWQSIIIVLGLIGVALAALIYYVVRDTPPGEVDVRHSSEGVSIFAGLMKIVTCKQSWLTALYGGLMFAPTPALGAMWGTSYLVTTRGISLTTADFIISILFIGWAVGSPLFGAFSDRIGRRKPPMYIGSAGALVSILLFLYIPHASNLSLIIYMFFFGFFCSGFIVGFSVIRESHARSFSGTSLGFMNVINTLGAAAAPSLIGAFLAIFWNGTKVDGLAIYSAGNYYAAMATLPVFVLISLVILPFIKETYCKSK
jgi:MFS family permease